MPNVFIVHEDLAKRQNRVTGAEVWVPTKNFAAARTYGDLRYLTPSGRLPENEAHVVKLIDERIRDFTPDDYLLLVGSPIAIGVAMALATRYVKGPIKVLVWNRERQAYDCHTLPF